MGHDTKSKNILIFGDSYSTFEGYIPQGYATYYTNAGHERTDVRHVEETWWYRLCRRMDLNLIQNNSWSGSTVGYTGYSGRDCSGDSSFLFRLEKLASDGFFEENSIDTVLVFGGTNDSWSQAPLGEIKLADWSREDFYTVLPSVCCIVYRLRELLPNARVVYMVNTDIKPQIGEAAQAACDAFGASCLKLANVDKLNRHPTIQGMKDIEEQVAAFLQE